MNSERDILRRDLTILEKMLDRLPEYLQSDETYWETKEPDMPKMTIGGCLMRLDRLDALRRRMAPDDQENLDRAKQTFADALEDHVVRFEKRAHQELHARLSEWVAYLKDLSRHMVADEDYYADIVDVRVVITALLDKMRTAPYQVQQQVVDEINSLDQNLRTRWYAGEFVWPAVWQPAYPLEKYWYLYGKPR